MGQQLKRNASGATVAAVAPMATYGELFADGAMIELIAGVHNGNPALMLWDGAAETIGARVEHHGQLYEPAQIDGSVLRELTLPTQCCPHGGTRDLLAEICKLVTDLVGLDERSASLVGRIVLCSHLLEAIPVAPTIIVVGPDVERAKLLMTLLRCLCRHALPLTGVTPAGFCSLASGARFTYLISQSSLSDKLRKLLDDASSRDSKIPSRGGLLDLFGVQIIHSDPIFAGDSWPTRSIHIAMIPTEQALPAFDLDAEHKITNEFQAKLLSFRRTNLGVAHRLNFDASKFTFALRDLARSIAAATPDDLELQAEVFGLPLLTTAMLNRTRRTKTASWRLGISGTKPYGLARYDKQTGQNPKFPLTGGLDIKYGLSSNLVLNLTGNTDFADTEVDLEPFNLTPFKVFIPEKRQFFLENAGVFNFDIGDQDQLFFSRQIGIDPITGQQVPINGGAKLTGTIGRTELGVMDVDTRSSGPNPYANYAVVRLKESLWPGSYIGVMGIDKRSGNTQDSFNQTGGVDTRLIFFKDWFVDAHMAGTRSPGDPSGASDVGASLSYRSNWLDGIVERRKIGPNFNPEVGFIERTDSNETYGDLTFKVRPELNGLRELQFEGFILHAPSTQNVVETQEWQGTFRAEFNNGAYTDDDIADVFTQRITTPLHIYKNVFIPVGLYHFARHQLTYGSGQDRRFTYNFFERFGDYYGGTLNEFQVRANYQPTAKFSISVSETWDRFRLPLPNGNFSVVLASLQANYSFNRFLTFTSLVQMDTSNTEAVSANLRLRYNYRPDSDLYIIYNVGTQFASIAPANPPQVRETRFAVKWTYSFAP